MRIASVKPFLVILMGFFLVVSCQNKAQVKKQSLATQEKLPFEEAQYRPSFHFTPNENWMNDPNGMFYLNNIYHLYFQYYPKGNTWGPMHWGHATSKDLVSWKEEQIALYPDDKGYIFSGSAVVDYLNSSGFGTKNKPPIVAVFTYHDPEIEKINGMMVESQAIAYSNDGGYHWTKYKDNPVIKNPGIRDFRDPKMSWDSIHKQWILILAAGNRDRFYVSKDLKHWNFQSEFGAEFGAHSGVWECPDFFPMQVYGTSQTKWILLQSINPGAPNGGSGTQYFVGDFDGKTFRLDPTFKNDLLKQKAIWLDYGRDNYAGVTWSDIPQIDGRRLFLGWMSNWDYAQKVPTKKWRSSMTIPRELKLLKQNGHYRMTSNPVNELQKYVSKTVNKKIVSVKNLTEIINHTQIDFFESQIEFDLNNLKKDNYVFLLQNSKGDTLEFGINLIDSFYFVDRTKTGINNFSDKFAKPISKAPIPQNINTFKVRMFLDKTSLELFFNDGETVFTNLFFIKTPFEEFTARSVKTPFKIENFTINQLSSNIKNVKK